MSDMTLSVDDGPDISVPEACKRASVETFCPKSGKNVGSAALYQHNRKLLCHLIDRRQPLGKVRRAFIVRDDNEAAPNLIRLTGNHSSVKAVLRHCGVKHPLVSVSMDDIEVSDTEG